MASLGHVEKIILGAALKRNDPQFGFLPADSVPGRGVERGDSDIGQRRRCLGATADQRAPGGVPHFPDAGLLIVEDRGPVNPHVLVRNPLPRHDRICRVPQGLVLGTVHVMGPHQHVYRYSRRHIAAVGSLSVVKSLDLRRGLHQKGRTFVRPRSDPALSLNDLVIEKQLLARADVLDVFTTGDFRPAVNSFSRSVKGFAGCHGVQ
jgi:hypothetical protein